MKSTFFLIIFSFLLKWNTFALSETKGQVLCANGNISIVIDSYCYSPSILTSNYFDYEARPDFNRPDLSFKSTVLINTVPTFTESLNCYGPYGAGPEELFTSYYNSQKSLNFDVLKTESNIDAIYAFKVIVRVHNNYAGLGFLNNKQLNCSDNFRY
jgi:hypothetical protein